MKLIKLAAAALITLSSLTAQAAYLDITGGTTTNISSSGANHNYFKANGAVTAPSFNVGGNLVSNFSGTVTLKFTYLGAEASYENKFITSAGSFTNAPGKAYGTSVGSSFVLSDSFSLGEAIGFSFKKGTSGGLTVANGANNEGDTTLSFATLLAGSFNASPFDAILFFDDTGGYQDDDNHDDLVVGVQVISVPESSTLVLMMMGLLGLFAARRMKA
ncbi:MAG TPA: PEP-CTERM sorting domain-containing protein [Cellvibrio sp.]|nr:PEP-CTERM sorting domain-containing protein [Cellvibrio sp.]